MFKKILIANRGEIALRIIRACHELGIKAVAVYSTADEYSLHVKFADEAVCIGPGPSSESYLNVPRIIAAGEITNADAIHPGYGFLAEDANFSHVCSQNNFTFIGPTADIIDAMGNKSQAKSTMQAANVPVIPGSNDIITNSHNVKEIASKIGLPVMFKASAGGGGKGMRFVSNINEAENAFKTAQAEAQAAFGNGDIQRRHQKLVEESPSVAVDKRLRKKLGRMAVTAVKSVGYVGVGTVEFLLDKNKDFYFMEMNTRIQVEHPITEMVTGVDLIKQQIKMHAGETVPEHLKRIELNGHSIECRINAEDPANNFSPSPILITSFHMPGGKGVRIDTHAYAGYEIPTYYDSMIGKLIVHASTRERAITRMRQALSECVIEGPKTTIPYHKQILDDERFITGEYDTSFLETFEFKTDNNN
jgi:acetyl-CoA carboxylase biotin carboxylase subunit